MKVEIQTYCCPNAVIYLTCGKCGRQICDRCAERGMEKGNFVCKDCSDHANLPQPTKFGIRRVS